MTVPDGVKSISGKAFYVPITAPLGTTEIIMSAPNVELRSVRLAGTVTVIGAEAFSIPSAPCYSKKSQMRVKLVSAAFSYIRIWKMRLL
ncbi:MAG: hypothetical protein J6P20_00665 [Oscillospiraceae bacterium]|nr:hypothetical protein [Oscillospiraceae bacterium]